MTTGPRPTPHPIILHVDDSNNPVRLAEASSIYVTSATIVSATITTLSATNYLGLGGNGGPEGVEGSIQYKSNNAFDGKEEFRYDEDSFTLVVPNINSTNTTTASNLRSVTTSSTNLSAINIRATSISATTVCATNYDTLLDALSFQNLDNRYLNSSGDSVTGSIYIQNLSSTNLSATYWLNLPSSLATWNANAIQGIAVTSTQPTPGQTLIYKDGIWQPSSVAGVVGGSPDGDELSIQFRNGSFFSGVGSIKYNSSISGIQSIGLSSTNLSSVNYRGTTISAVTVCAAVVSATTYQNLGKDIPQWNANRIYDTAFSKSELIYGDFITYDGATAWANTRKETAAELVSPQLHTETWNASSLRGYQVTSTAPINNQLLMYNGTAWVPTSSTFNLGTVNTTNSTASALTAVTGTVTTLSATNARITGLSATTISATTWQGLPPTNASAFGGLVSGFVSPTFGDLLIIGFGDNNITNITPAVAAPGLASVLTNGNEGFIQFRGPAGQFSSAPDLYYSPEYKSFSASNIFIPDGGTINTNFITVRNGANLNGLIKIQTVSATAYTLFGTDTSSANTVTPPSNNNQNIVYDSVAQKWKPGYAVYQATGTPAVGLGSNGDIYFQYLP